MKEFQDGLDWRHRGIPYGGGELKKARVRSPRSDQLQARFDDCRVKIDGMMDKIRSGQGTVGQLLVNPQLNEALAGTTREFQELMKGLRTNPRKFVTIF